MSDMFTGFDDCPLRSPYFLSPLSTLLFLHYKASRKILTARGLLRSMDNDPCLAQYSAICSIDLPSHNEKHILYLVRLLNFIINRLCFNIFQYNTYIFLNYFVIFKFEVILLNTRTNYRFL